MQTTFYILYVQKEIVSPGEDDVEEIFYVGRTSDDIQRRLHGHLSDGRKQRTQKGKYIYKKLQEGKQILVKEIQRAESVEPSVVAEIEQDLISKYTEYGHPLQNTATTTNCGGYKGQHSRINWTADIIDKLGTVPDSVIAQELQCSKTQIALKRQELNITSYLGSRWTKERLSLLGVISDYELAKLMDCRPCVVWRKRQELNILPSRNSKWTAEAIDMLGKLPDAIVARHISCGETTVARKREELGIATPKRGRAWSKEEIDLLGKQSDASIAKLIGVSAELVRLKRIELNIASCKYKPPTVWTVDVIAKLGVIADEEIARETGLTLKQVKKKRGRLSIKQPKLN